MVKITSHKIHQIFILAIDMQSSVYITAIDRTQKSAPSKHKHLYNIYPMPAQRFRRWSNVV